MGTAGTAHARAEVLPPARVLAALASLGVHDDGTLTGAPLAEDDFAELLRLAEQHRLLGALAEAIAVGAFVVTETQMAAATERHNRWLVNALVIDRLLLRVDACLSVQGIDYRVLKGVALSRTAYADPAWRVYGDLDLLLPSPDFVPAVAALTRDLGGRRPIPELRPGFDREFGREATLEVGFSELDLHRTLVDGAFGHTIGLDDLLLAPTRFDVGGRSVPALGPTAAFLHACYDVSLGDFPVRLSALRDLLLLHERGVDVGAVTDMARRWRGEVVVERAARLAIDTLLLPRDHGLHAYVDLGSPRRQRWLLRSYGGRPGAYATHLASTAVIRGIRPRLRYLHAVACPSRDYLAARGWTRRDHVLQAARTLAGTGGRRG